MIRALALAGPTACGKTDLALAVAPEIAAEIVSVDSRAVYRGLDIAAAKPAAAEMAQTPHHLIDVVNPDEKYDVGRFFADCLDAARRIAARGRLPLLVGGTMMYFNALRGGLCPAPPIDDESRDLARRQIQAEGAPAAHARLAAIDPETAARLALRDEARIGRALEVFYASKIPLSRWRAMPPAPADVAPTMCALLPADAAGREMLRERIRRRTREMFARGLVAEVDHFIRDWNLRPESPALRALGCREIARGIAVGDDAAQMEEDVARATMRLAKRQMTWLRSFSEATIFDPFAPDLARQIVRFARAAAVR